MGDHIKEFLSKRNYPKDIIKKYTTHGGWVVIILKTFDDFVGLLNQVHYLRKNFSWNEGPALPTLKFHSDKLLKIRQYSTSKQNLLLRNYIYLRDAADTNYSDQRIQSSLWEQVLEAKEMANFCNRPVNRDQRALLPAQPEAPSPDPKDKPKRSTKCPTCDSRGFHNRFVPPFGPGSANCPLKAHKAIAKDIRKRVCAAAQAEGKEKFDMAYVQPHIAAAIAAAADE